MFIPLGTDRLTGRRPIVTCTLIALNLAIFLGLAIVVRMGLSTDEEIIRFGAVHRTDFRIWTPVTSLFLHDPTGLMHIGFNMLFLWIFGQALESRLGSWWFLLFYLAGGVAASLTHLVASPYPAIGASGAVAAVSGAYLVLFPRSTVKVLFVFLFIGIFHIPAPYFIGLYFLLDLLGQVSAMFGAGGSTAYAAHLGGTFFGVSTALVLLSTGILKSTDLDLLYLLKQRRRRAEMRSAARTFGTPFDHAGPTSGVPRRVDASVASPPDPDAPLRRQIVAALREDRTEEALELYRSAPASLALPDADQADLGNRAVANSDAELAVRAYRRLLERRGELTQGAGGSSDDFRLLIASLLIRRLGRPSEARPFLDELGSRPLSAQYLQLRDALLDEMDMEAETP